MTSSKLSTIGIAATLAVLSACSSPPSRRIADAPVQVEPASSQYGRVSLIEVVAASTRTSGGGAVLGAVIGAAVGNQIGSGNGRAAAIGIGAVGGAVAGNEIEKRRNSDDVYRISVRFDDGHSEAFNFQRIDNLRVGDRVMYDGRELRMM